MSRGMPGHGALGLCAAVALLLRASTALGGDACKLELVVNLPVMIDDQRALVPVGINGSDERLLLDSGSFCSMLSAGAAARLRLPSFAPPSGMDYARFIGGSASLSAATVERLRIAKVTVPDVQFFVIDQDFGDLAGLLGQNLLRLGDVEYDLAAREVSVFKTEGCGTSGLAYWPSAKPASAIGIEAITPRWPFTTGTASLNGVRVRVMFDTGASSSYVSRQAAKRAGVRHRDEPMTQASQFVRMRRARIDAWSGTFASFRIGDEEARDLQLPVIEADMGQLDIVLGMDFFLAHHVFVARSQRQLYFTSNTGQMFVGPAATPEAPVR